MASPLQSFVRTQCAHRSAFFWICTQHANFSKQACSPVLELQDSSLVDKNLTKTDVDIIFAKACKSLGCLTRNLETAGLLGCLMGRMVAARLVLELQEGAPSDRAGAVRCRPRNDSGQEDVSA